MVNFMTSVLLCQVCCCWLGPFPLGAERGAAWSGSGCCGVTVHAQQHKLIVRWHQRVVHCHESWCRIIVMSVVLVMQHEFGLLTEVLLTVMLHHEFIVHWCSVP